MPLQPQPAERSVGSRSGAKCVAPCGGQPACFPVLAVHQFPHDVSVLVSLGSSKPFPRPLQSQHCGGSVCFGVYPNPNTLPVLSTSALPLFALPRCQRPARWIFLTTVQAPQRHASLLCFAASKADSIWRSFGFLLALVPWAPVVPPPQPSYSSRLGCFFLEASLLCPTEKTSFLNLSSGSSPSLFPKATFPPSSETHTLSLCP